MNPDLQQILKGKIKPPGCLPLFRVSPSFPRIIKYGPGVGVGIPLFRIFLQKIDSLSLVPGLTLKMLHSNADQVQIPHRNIIRPEFACKPGHPACILRLQQHFHPPVQPRHLLHKVFRLKSRLPCKISVIRIGKRAEIALEPGQAFIMADDGKPLQVIQHIRRSPGKPCGKQFLQKYLHLPRGFLHMRHVIFLGFHNLSKQRLLRHGACLQLAPKDGGRLMYTQFLLMAAAGGIFQRRQQLYRMVPPGQLYRDHRGRSDLRTDPGSHLIYESLKLPDSQRLFQFFKRVSAYFFPDWRFFRRTCFI